jgi:hypothetical protein
MDMKAVVSTTLLLLALTGCSQPAAPVPEATPAQPDAGAAPAAESAEAAPRLPPIVYGSVVDLAVGDKDQQSALPLFGDQSVGFSVTNSAAGELVGVGILVGNYGGTSRGGIDLEVCVAAECRKVNIDTASSIDNEILAFPVEPALSLQAGSELKLTLSRQTGTNEFAVWTFPFVDGAAKLESDDPAFENRTARVQLLLK